jgi:MoxR-like ATPase
VEVSRNTVETLERIVTHRELGVEPDVPEVMRPEELVSLLNLIRRIYLPDAVANYIARLVHATHPGECPAAEGIRFGASPRAALSLASASKARALMEGRVHASFEDVKAVAIPVLQHRLVLEYSARIEGRTPRDIVVEVLKQTPFQAHPTPKPLKEEQPAGA